MLSSFRIRRSCIRSTCSEGSPLGFVLINSTQTLDALHIEEFLSTLPLGHVCAFSATDLGLKYLKRPIANGPLLGAFAAITGLIRLASRGVSDSAEIPSVRSGRRIGLPRGKRLTLSPLLLLNKGESYTMRMQIEVPKPWLRLLHSANLRSLRPIPFPHRRTLSNGYHARPSRATSDAAGF